MDPVTLLPKLYAAAWLVPLASFALIVLFGPRMGKAGKGAGYLATAAILTSCALSLFALFFVWLPKYDLPAPVEHEETAAHAPAEHGAGEHGAGEHAPAAHAAHAEAPRVRPIAGDWYSLGQFGACASRLATTSTRSPWSCSPW